MDGGILGWLAVAGAAITGIGLIWRGAVRPLVRGIERVVDVLGPDEHGRTITDRLKTVEERTAQLVPNGGNSMYDRVGKLEDTVDRLEKEHQATNRRITAVTKGLAPMAEAIALLAGPRRRADDRRKNEGDAG